MHTAGEGEGEMNGESSIETYALPYVEQTASGKLQCNLRELSSGLCDIIVGWVGGSRGRGHMYAYD